MTSRQKLASHYVKQETTCHRCTHGEGAHTKTGCEGVFTEIDEAAGIGEAGPCYCANFVRVSEEPVRRLEQEKEKGLPR